MGTLEVQGTLDPNQFSPSGTSDGDIAQVRVKRVDTFEGKVTHAFERAEVRGRVQTPAIDAQGGMTVRLQISTRPSSTTCRRGPAARPKPKGKTLTSASCGRATAQAFGKFLQVLGTERVFDTYGRFIGFDRRRSSTHKLGV
jgi:hypothetical protein